MAKKESTPLDIEASEILGASVDNITKEESDYIKTRKKALEAFGALDSLTVQNAMQAEFNVKRIRKEIQRYMNNRGTTTEDLKFTKQERKRLTEEMDEEMVKYNHAMDTLGVRKLKVKDSEASPISELWLRYQEAIKLKQKRGEEVGLPTKEAMQLADKKGDETGLRSDYKVKGVLPNDVRRKAIEEAEYPTIIDEKKNLMSIGVMLDDFMHDPVLAASCILSEVLVPKPDYPFTPPQELRLFGMWSHKFFVDSAGFGTGKTFCAAIICALRCVLMSHRHIGILSDTFAQGKLFFEQYFDPWLKRCPIFASQVEMSIKGSNFHVTHNDDGYTMYFRNHSTLKTLPPNFMNDAKRLKSESWTDFIGDEWTAWFNVGKSQHVIKGRVRCPIGHEYDDTNPIFDHHQAFIGAADYTWRSCYEMIKQYEVRVKEGSKKHCVQSWNYLDFAPKWRKTKYGIDEENIEEMMNNMTKDEVERLVMARWMNDSTGYYLASEVMACRE